ncbi:hypothetical protein [Streptomyces achromogenes]|uniref:hypothetical protein n=1 Tax=Streptomyces achromogenes TaxID=67255 RepID=UPI0036B0C8E2
MTGRSDREESAARFEVQRLATANDDPHFGFAPWGVIDRLAGRWVEAGGEVDTYVTEDGARQCVRRLRYLADSGLYRP